MKKATVLAFMFAAAAAFADDPDAGVAATRTWVKTQIAEAMTNFEIRVELDCLTQTNDALVVYKSNVSELPHFSKFVKTGTGTGDRDVYENPAFPSVGILWNSPTNSMLTIGETEFAPTNRNSSVYFTQTQPPDATKYVMFGEIKITNAQKREIEAQ